MNSIFNENNIVLNQRFIKKNEAIEAAGKILLEQGYVTKEYIPCMHKREEALTTYIGNHVAIPHGINESAPYIKESGISLIQVPDGVSFGDETAYIIIGVAGKDGSHLDILMQLSEVIMEEENVEKLRTAATKEEILNIIGDLSA
ncbi:MAG: PTS sugar transporter subunit IIA [Anaerostipes sp.]|jgi:PTS system mannitol-specific IIA component|nr:PTS sugar transporter subunit IIA [Anaerostipes sp.]MDD3745859.1 PTS sugar transporter subunit IIA [Anaerostipes sp.]